MSTRIPKSRPSLHFRKNDRTVLSKTMACEPCNAQLNPLLYKHLNPVPGSQPVLKIERIPVAFQRNAPPSPYQTITYNKTDFRNRKESSVLKLLDAFLAA